MLDNDDMFALASFIDLLVLAVKDNKSEQFQEKLRVRISELITKGGGYNG